MLGQRGGLAPPATYGLMGGGGVGSVSFWFRLAYIVYVLHWCTQFLVASLGHYSFRWTTRWSRLTGHDGYYFGGLFVFVVGSVVAFGRFEVPFPQ